MNLFGRQDMLLIASLTAAVVMIFSTSISRLLDYIRDIENRSGLTLLPALVLIARADHALYRAKNDGRNCVRIASETALVS